MAWWIDIHKQHWPFNNMGKNMEKQNKLGFIRRELRERIFLIYQQLSMRPAWGLLLAILN
jgi:hypothetical protein